MPDIVIVNVSLTLSRYIESTIRKKWKNKCKIICYGFYSTLFPERNKKFADTVVIGDIVNVWQNIVSDIKNNALAKLYISNRQDQFPVDRTIESKYGFTPILSQLRTSFGCTCPKEQKDFCYENILYKEFVQWDINSVVEEISRMKRKIIFIRDDDFLYDLDYAIKVLEKSWRYKKMWTFQTAGNFFDHSHILPSLREDGVRIIYLKENWLDKDLINKMNNREYTKEKKYEVGLIHNNRIAVGGKLRLGYEGEDYVSYRRLLKFLIDIRLDFIQVTVQTPMPKTNTYEQYLKSGLIVEDLTLFDQWMPVVQAPSIDPQVLYSWMEWLRDRFYSWDSIFLRSVHISAHLGLYNTIFFYLVPNLSYRNNFLEKVGYPP